MSLAMRFHARIGDAMAFMLLNMDSAIRCFSSFRSQTIWFSIALLNAFGAFVWAGRLSNSMPVRRLLSGTGIMLIAILLLVLGFGPFVGRRGRQSLIKESRQDGLFFYDFVPLQLAGIVLFVSSSVVLLLGCQSV